MRWSSLLIPVIGVLCTHTSVAAAAENPLARRSSTEEWDAEQRRLKIATGIWWGTFAALNISGIPTCVIASRDLKEGAAAWCAIASIASAVTLVGASSTAFGFYATTRSPSRSATAGLTAVWGTSGGHPGDHSCCGSDPKVSNLLQEETMRRLPNNRGVLPVRAVSLLFSPNNPRGRQLTNLRPALLKSITLISE